MALALLADHLGNDEEALGRYHLFKWQVVAMLPAWGWTLTSREIDEALQRIEVNA